MPKSRKRKIKRKSRSRPSWSEEGPISHSYLTNLEPEEAGFPDASSWPVVRAYVPVHDVWRATGFGTAGVIREKPDGRWAHSFFWISLLEDGIVNMFGKEDEDPNELDAFLAKLKPDIPPFEEGPVDLVAEYIWGAYVYSLERGARWPPGMIDRFLNMVPKPPGSRSKWLNRFSGPAGLTPHGLTKVAQTNADVQEEMPEGKEIAILSSSTFRTDDADLVVERLRKRSPEFAYGGRDQDAELFSWTRKYPQRHWNPLAVFSGRQVIGSVTVEPGRMVVEAKALSLAARLIGLLKEMFGDRIALEETTWHSLNDLRDHP